jgi:tRNA 2-thiouridine synthesizing protein E
MTVFTPQELSVAVDAEGFLVDPAEWTEQVAEELARADGSWPLSDEQWTIIRFVRRQFEEKGGAPNVRALSKASGTPVADLYRMFPKGPAKTAARIAGAPKPRGCI